MTPNSQGVLSPDTLDLLGDYRPSAPCHVSLFWRLTDTHPTTRTLGLAELADLIRTAPAIAAWGSDPQPLLSFAAYDGEGIGSHNIRCYRGIALDFDRDHGATFASLVASLKLDGWHGLVHTTRKHTPAEPRLRLLLPFERAAGLDEAMQIARFLADSIGGGVVPAPESFARGQRFFYAGVVGKESTRRVEAVKGGAYADAWARQAGFVYDPAPIAAGAETQASLAERREIWIRDRARIEAAARALAPSLGERAGPHSVLNSLLFPLHRISGGQPDGWALFAEIEALTGRAERLRTEIGRAKDYRDRVARYRADWRGATRRDGHAHAARFRDIGSLFDAALAAGWADTVRRVDPEEVFAEWAAPAEDAPDPAYTAAVENLTAHCIRAVRRSLRDLLGSQALGPEGKEVVKLALHRARADRDAVLRLAEIARVAGRMWLEASGSQARYWALLHKSA